MSHLHVPVDWLLMTIVATIFVLVYPFILAATAHRRLAVAWKYFWFGTLVFLVSQLLTRVPLIYLLSHTALASLLSSSIAFVWVWLAIEAVTAGLFEEVGRAIGYHAFMRREPKTWSKGVMFGLGHGALESIVVFGGSNILTLLNIVVFSAINLASLPVAQRQLIMQQATAINTQPFWFPLLTIWDRLWGIPLHVALSIIVLQMFRRHQRRWLVLAILLHALIDFITLALPQAFGPQPGIQLLEETLMCAFGLLGVWIIWRLRDPGDEFDSKRIGRNIL